MIGRCSLYVMESRLGQDEQRRMLQVLHKGQEQLRRNMNDVAIPIVPGRGGARGAAC